MKHIILLLILPLSIFVQAQDKLVSVESLSLEDYRKKVLEYSQELKMSKEDVKIAEHNKKIARAAFFPRVDLAADGSYGFFKRDFLGMKLSQFSYNAEARLSQTLFIDNKVNANFQSAKIKQEIAELNAKLSAEDIALNADLIYWQLSTYFSDYEIAKEYVDVVDTLYNIINDKFDDGLVSKSDLLMIATRLTEANLQLNKVTYSLNAAKQNFNIIMGMPPESPIGLSDKVDQELLLLQKQGLDGILSLRQEYRISEAQVNLAQQNIRVAQSKFNPSLNLGANATYGTQMFNVNNNGVFNSAVFLSFSFPVLDWGEAFHSIKASRVQLNKQKLGQVDIKDKISTQLSTAWSQMSDSYEQHILAKTNLDIAKENLELTTFRYTEGQLPIVDVLNSQLSWMQAYYNYITAHYTYKVAYSNYLKATGQLNL